MRTLKKGMSGEDVKTLQRALGCVVDGATAGVLRSGTTANRPSSTDIYVGFEYFDTDLGLKVVWNGTSWIVLPKYEVVNALPASPDSDTLYLIAEL